MARKHSEETKNKMKKSALNSWKSGRIAWNKGLTKETSEKVRMNSENISKSLMGHKHTKVTIGKIIKKAIGRKHTNESKEKISLGVKNNPRVMNSKFRKGHMQSEEINKKKSCPGEKNPAWIDGRSYDKHYLPEFKKIRKEILKRDVVCVICKDNKKLAVHHIDYDKTNNISHNLICLCNSCHSKTNWNRKRWIKYFGDMK